MERAHAQQALLTSRSEPQRRGAVPEGRVRDRRPEIGHLQRAVGNRRMQRLLDSRALQAKLTVSRADDAYEREADRVADQVMRMAVPDARTAPGVASRADVIQRACPKCEREEGDEEEALLVRARQDGTPTASELPHTESFAGGLEGHGQPLPAAVRTFMEPRFGADFGAVRLHTGGEADRSAREISALAYTSGHHIVFRAGHYQPATHAGRRLLAHELTHVLQQGGGAATSLRRAPRMIQRLGDVSKRPAALDLRCLLPAASPTSVAEFVEFGDTSTKLSSLDGAKIDNFVRNWHATGTRQTVTVDGFASRPGADELNWELSCGRAEAVLADLLSPQGGGPGIPRSKVLVFAHGETDEFGAVARNRRATLSLSGGTPPPPPAETITSQTVATSPGARTRTTIGVGEEVNLTHAPGSAAWSTTVGATPLSATNGVKVIFTAPDTFPVNKKKITVTAGGATIDFDVLAPTSVAQQRVTGTGMKHTVNLPDSGFAALTFIGPDTVNFSKIRWREMDVAGVATAGAYSCNPFSGGHCGAGGGGAACADNPLSSTVVAGKGTQDLPPPDCAYSGHCGGSPPFAPGSVSLSIPYEYKVGTGAFHPIINVPQVHTLAANASTLTTAKAGESGNTTVTTATTAIAQCP